MAVWDWRTTDRDETAFSCLIHGDVKTIATTIEQMEREGRVSGWPQLVALGTIQLSLDKLPGEMRGPVLDLLTRWQQLEVAHIYRSNGQEPSEGTPETKLVLAQAQALDERLSKICD